MRSGIAKAIRETYPRAFDDYFKTYTDQDNSLELGQVILTKYPDRVIFNMITQEFYGRDPNRVYVSYDAIRMGIRSLNLFSYCKCITSIGFPMIGAGLANGDWKIIADIIEKEAEFQPVVYVLEGA